MNCAASEACLWGCLPVDRKEVREVLAAMCELTGCGKGSSVSGLELIVTDDAGSETCNREHLGMPGPTNILSFPLSQQTDSESGGAGGSLVLSVLTLRRESLLYGQDPAEHAIRLLAHGVAHLAGLEHGPEMWALCSRLEKAGLDRLTAMRDGE